MSARRHQRIRGAGAGRRAGGATLVELMVALLLGMVLTAGVIQIFLGNRATYAFNEGLARIQENGRFAVEHMAYAARMAGYAGCMNDIPVESLLTGTNDFLEDLSNGLQGHEFVGTGPGSTYDATAVNPAASNDAALWEPPLPPELAGEGVIAGSDVLVVRNVSATSIALTAPFTDGSRLFAATPHTLEEGQIAVVTDCQKASIFQITAIDNGGADVVHGDSSSFTPGNSSPQLAHEYGLGAELGALEATAFYIGAGASGPALFQLRLARDDGHTSAFRAEELVDGIDTMQVLYGVDTDADGQVDDWVTASNGIDWQSVVAVQLALLARAPEEYGTERDATQYVLARSSFDPVDDRRVRQVFSTTVGLRNRLP